ncbi:hypothetical protein HPB48_022002 [Haemaphysalis longicornis]|uniref:Uncharacterized protein n=1 Tax=Haemaphysalis longicornis TaxID=44386 RepID=A0A9J6FSX3_HAELO|nr:hypothetical protein HPB48_022002 [Haemaphysalis longicornis]
MTLLSSTTKDRNAAGSQPRSCCAPGPPAGRPDRHQQRRLWRGPGPGAVHAGSPAHLPHVGHELYNCTQRELVARYVCPHLLPDWTPPSSDDPVFYYSFSPVPGVKLISLDCFEESVLGRDPSELRWQQAAQLLTRVHGTTDPEVWEWPDNLQGLDKRFIDSNGALNEAQLHWLGGS